MTFTDRAGRDIEVGDIIAYTSSSEGAGTVHLGRVTRYSAKTIWVQGIDPQTLDTQMIDDGYMRGTGQYSKYNPNYEYQEFVKTGVKEVGETLVANPQPHRFYIIRKV